MDPRVGWWIHQGRAVSHPNRAPSRWCPPRQSALLIAGAQLQTMDWWKGGAHLRILGTNAHALSGKLWMLGVCWLPECSANKQTLFARRCFCEVLADVDSKVVGFYAFVYNGWRMLDRSIHGCNSILGVFMRLNWVLLYSEVCDKSGWFVYKYCNYTETIPARF